MLQDFGNIVAVDDVSLRGEERELSHCLGAQWLRKDDDPETDRRIGIPTKGRIFIKGEDVTDTPPYKRETNLVFQDFALFPHMNVLNNIGFGLRMRGVQKRQSERSKRCWIWWSCRT